MAFFVNYIILQKFAIEIIRTNVGLLSPLNFFSSNFKWLLETISYITLLLNDNPHATSVDIGVNLRTNPVIDIVTGVEFVAIINASTELILRIK